MAAGDKDKENSKNRALDAEQRKFERQMLRMLKKMGNTSGVYASSIEESTTKLAKDVKKSTSKVSDGLKSVSDIIKSREVAAAQEKAEQELKKRLGEQSKMFDSERAIERNKLKAIAQDLTAQRSIAQQHIDGRKKELEEERAALSEKQSVLQKQMAGSKEKLDLEQDLKNKQISINEIGDQITEIQTQLAAEQRASFEGLADVDQDAIDSKLDQLAELESTRSKEIAVYQEMSDRLRVMSNGHDKTRAELEKVTKELAATTKELDEELSKSSEHIATIETTLSAVEKEYKKLNPSILEDTINGIKDYTKGLLDKAPAIFSGMLGKAAYDVKNRLYAEINRGVETQPVSDYAISQLGMTGAEFVEATAEFRRSMLASENGVTGFADSLAKFADNEILERSITDPAQRAAFGLQSLEMMTRAGIKPTQEAVSKFADGMAESFKVVQRASGMTGEMFTTHIRDIIEDESTQSLLRRAANADERRAIVDSVRMREQENIAMGISAEQSKLMAKQMASMAADGPLERFKKSMKLQMLGGAMGVAGSERASELYRKGGKRSAAENAELQQFMSALSNIQSTAMGEMTAASFQIEQFGIKSGFDAEKLSAFNTKQIDILSDTIKQNQETQAKMIDDSSSRFIADAISGFHDVANAIIKAPIFSAIVGALGLLGSKLLIHNTSILQNTQALIANTAAKTTGELTPNVDGSPDKKGKWAKMAKVGAGVGVGALLMLAASPASDALTESGHEKLGASVDVLGDAASYGMMGASLGTFFGPGGTLIGGGIGALGGAGYSLIKNWDTLFGSTDNQADIKPSQQQEQSRNMAESATVTPTTEPLASPASDRVATVQEPAAIASTIRQTSDDTNRATADASSAQSSLQQKTIDQQLQQINKMSEANNYLKVVADHVPTLVELANKQLVATTMTDREKKENRDVVRRGGSGFSAASYQYLN